MKLLVALAALACCTAAQLLRGNPQQEFDPALMQALMQQQQQHQEQQQQQLQTQVIARQLKKQQREMQLREQQIAELQLQQQQSYQRLQQLQQEQYREMQQQRAGLHPHLISDVERSQALYRMTMAGGQPTWWQENGMTALTVLALTGICLGYCLVCRRDR
eukprot:TRINITY_DN18303_c0_g1_i1.p2 TRINITY_DN18303_c0_g1~~TRINITY_DN18303_c0_g1_i1.p2  ORF type:complete len:161 (+),score=82.57 TRINITY_DN18303_c0_g1_i1:86-568(+)